MPRVGRRTVIKGAAVAAAAASAQFSWALADTTWGMPGAPKAEECTARAEARPHHH
ncbi:hypothetical protein ACWGDT_32765 [Streptomyces avermitilis]